MIFILIETADVEVIGLRVFNNEASANACFDRVCLENQANEEEVKNEIAGTLRIAGDDAYAVQLMQRVMSPI